MKCVYVKNCSSCFSMVVKDLNQGYIHFPDFIIFDSILEMILQLNDAEKINLLIDNLSCISPYHSKVFPVFLEYSLCQNAYCETAGVGSSNLI